MSNSTSNCIQKEGAHFSPEVTTKMFITALFLIAPNQKPSPSTLKLVLRDQYKGYLLGEAG